MQQPASLWQRLKANRIAYHLFLICALIAAMAVGAHLLMQVGTRHGIRRTVPDFSGMPLREAQRAARRHDLRLQINDSLFVPTYEGGIVLDQLPKGGVEVKPGRTVYITINSFRQKMVPVPYVADRSLRQAKNMLEIAGLEIDELIYRSDMATNYVLSQFVAGRAVTPTSRLEAEMGSGVTLYVGVAPGHNATYVPQAVGLTLKEAKGRLWESGLNVGKIEFDPGINLLNQKDARVYGQRPAPEQRLSLGAKVDLQLTLDARKLEIIRQEAEQRALEAAQERQRQEAARADSIARAKLEYTDDPETPQTAPEPPAASTKDASDSDSFFD